jgi:hypothetical protein
MLRKWHEIWSQVVFSRRLKDLCRHRLHRIDGTTPTGPRHIRAIAVAKGFQHHSLLPCDAAKEQNPKTDKPSESVFGRVVVVSFFIITLSIWLPIIAGAIALSLIGHFWSRIRGEPPSSNQEKNAARGRGWC